MAAHPASAIGEVLARWASSAEARDVVVLHAAPDAERGPWRRVHVSAVLRRPSLRDARHAPVSIASFAAPDPGASDERAIVDGVRTLARSLGVEAIVHAPTDGSRIVAERWIEAQPPAAPKAWTLDWRTLAYDARGVAHRSEGTMSVVARTPSDARQTPRLEHPAGAALVAEASLRVREIGESFHGTVHWSAEPMRSTIDRALVRRLSASGARPSAIFAQHAPTSPLDGMAALALAWTASLSDVEIAGALLRGEVTADAADEELQRVRARGAHEWLFAARLADAIAADRADPELVAMARRAGAIRTIQAFLEVTDLSLGEAKGLVGTLDALGARVTEPGVLSRELAQARAHRARRG